ncbi:MAG TPA: histidine kinase, partial [Phnomibacter sp.]|nr:histidine kinase [Phnomibacter sp.]
YAVSKVYNDPYYQVDQALETGKALLQLRQFDSGFYYLRQALAQSYQYNYLPKTKNILRQLALSYAASNNYNQAYQTAMQLSSFADSVVILQNHNRLLLNDARFELGKKETRIHSLEQETQAKSETIKRQNLLNGLLMGGAVLLTIILLLVYRTYRQRQLLQQQKIQQLETEKQLLATESLMQGEEKERTRLAKDLHDSLGGMLSGIKYSFQHIKGNLVLTPDNQQAFERGIDMLDKSIQELRRVAHNMMPEGLVRFGLDTALADYCHQMQATAAVDILYQGYGTQGWQIPTGNALQIFRIVQELINNSMKHAQATQIIVQLIKSDDHLNLTVED